MHQRKEPIMQTTHFTALRRRLLPLAALAAATALGGCVATAPAPGYYGYNYPSPYYNNGYTVTQTYPTYPNTTTYAPAYPLYSPYFHGYDTVQSGNGHG
jgi:hypothetical protein